MKEPGVLNELKVIWGAELFIWFMAHFGHFGQDTKNLGST